MLMMIEHLFRLDISVIEKIIRSVAIYVFLLIAFRILGKRQVGQMSAFDLVFLLIISNVVQNAIIGADNSLLGGMVGAITLFVLNFILEKISFRSKTINRLLEFQPTVLVHNGKVLQKNLKQELITHEELMAAIREHGVADIQHVRLAVLEEDGHISVIPKNA